MATGFDNQIQNRNFLSPIGFKFNLAGRPKVNFFCNYARIPEISLGTAIQSNYLKDIDVPGDRLTFGDFNLRFLVDENLENYLEIYNWLRGLGFPESATEFTNLTTNDLGSRDENLQFCDGSLHILNSNYNKVASVNFKDLFPTSISSLEFEASEESGNYLTADVSFKYTIYDIVTA